MEKFQIYKDTPYLEAIVGPMFSGKSQEISRRLKYIDHYNNSRSSMFDNDQLISYVLLRPDLDTRSDKIRPLPYDSGNCHLVKPDDLHHSLSGDDLHLYDKDYIILDEAQFFSSEVIDQVEDLLLADKYILVAGLDKDYLGNPFSKFMSWTLCLADDVTKLTAICTNCGAPATMAKLISDDPSEILDCNVVIEDDMHHYYPMCRKCIRKFSIIGRR